MNVVMLALPLDYGRGRSRQPRWRQRIYRQAEEETQAAEREQVKKTREVWLVGSKKSQVVDIVVFGESREV